MAVKRRRLVVRGALILAAGILFWSTPCCPHYTSSGGPISLARARWRCPIPLPKEATNIQFRSLIFFQAYEQTVRFEAPVNVCIAHVQTVADRWNAQHPTSLICDKLKPIVQTPNREGFLTDQPWFDIENIRTGVEVRGMGFLGPQIWIDTQRGVFYYFVSD